MQHCLYGVAANRQQYGRPIAARELVGHVNWELVADNKHTLFNYCLYHRYWALFGKSSEVFLLNQLFLTQLDDTYEHHYHGVRSVIHARIQPRQIYPARLAVLDPIGKRKELNLDISSCLLWNDDTWRILTNIGSDRMHKARNNR